MGETITSGLSQGRIYCVVAPTTRSIPGEGADIVFAGAGNDKIYARDTDSLDTIDCGGGFDEVETIYRDDRTLDNCERALGPRRGNI